GIGAEDHNHASELALIFIEIFLVFDGGANAFALDDAAGAGGPRLGISEKCDHVGRGHANVDVLIGPTASERSPGLEVCVGETHGGELVASPLIGALHVGGAGKALAD